MYVVVGLWAALAWLIGGQPDKPNGASLLFCVPLAMCKPAIVPYSGGIMPSLGVVALLRVDERASLWLGGTLQ